MTQAERDRLVALKKAKKKLITQKEAADELGITERPRGEGVKSQSFPGNRLAVLLGVERLRKWPKFAFHGGTAALHRESQPPCRRAIMGQLSIGAGFHTFLRRAVFLFTIKGVRIYNPTLA
jgi:hypothetical protein